MKTRQILHSCRTRFAHYAKLWTELEDGTAGGDFKLLDPFYVDGNLDNHADTAVRKSPLIFDEDVESDPLFPGSLPGSHPQHYGGVVLHENDSLIAGSPNYAVRSFGTFKNGTLTAKDTIPEWTDWSFLGWYKGDQLLRSSDSLLPMTNTGIVFVHDSEEYVARYKEHNVAFTNPTSTDTGYSYNNQSKLVYLGQDSLKRQWYQNIYASNGRIYTARGWHEYDVSWMHWDPEVLLSPWSHQNASFPAICRHVRYPNFDTIISFVFQADSDGLHYIYRGILSKDSAVPYLDQVYDDGQAESTPSIWPLDFPAANSYDVVAYAANDGLHVTLMPFPGLSGTPIDQVIDDANAARPTIWGLDSLTLGGGFTPSSVPFWVAWQNTHDWIPGSRNNALPPVSDIYCQKFKFLSGKGAYSVPMDEPKVNVSYKALPWSNWNENPRISGIRTWGTDSITLMLAYESHGQSATTTDTEGVEVSFVRSLDYTGFDTTWAHLMYFLASKGDLNTRPSILTTRTHWNGASWWPTELYYSLTYESNHRHDIFHIAYDGLAPRTTYWGMGMLYYLNLRDPQMSVNWDGRDSLAYRVCLHDDPGPTRWVIHQSDGLFKQAKDPTYDYYREIVTEDTARLNRVFAGLGNVNVDDGTGADYIDLKHINPGAQIDSGHAAVDFLSSQPFTLPEQGTLKYAAWLLPSDSSRFVQASMPVRYDLDFIDTFGNRLTLDAIEIDSDQASLPLQERSVDLDLLTSPYGHVELVLQSNPKLDSASAHVVNIMQPHAIEGFKRSQTVGSGTDASGLIISTDPNPFNRSTWVRFTLPSSGEASIDVFDPAGNKVTSLVTDGSYSAGEHQVRFHAERTDMPSGIYTVVLRFGNEVKTARVAYVK